MKALDPQFRPYASPSNVMAVFKRARSRNLPDIINNDFLRVAGIGDVVIGRVVQALQFLDLVQEDGHKTDKLEALSATTESEYRELLEKIVREAYRDEFDMIDPSQDQQHRIIDAFRPYKPRSQTNRMVMLFLGLCREAGIAVVDAPRDRQMKETPTRRQRSSTERRAVEEKPKVKPSRISEPAAATHGFGGVLFGVTEDDVAVLGEEEFKVVWDALGKVALARARARKEALQEKQVEQKIEESELEEE